jgi:signal transduction histidine kinase/ActR/RegA family two-component response regulator
MAANPEVKSLVGALLHVRASVSDAARIPEQQRLIGPILVEIDRAVAALAPEISASSPLTALDNTAPIPSEDVEALRREIERLQAFSQKERGLLEAVLTQCAHGIIVSDAQGRLILQNPASEKIWAGSATANNVEAWGSFRAFHPDGRPFEGGDWSMARCLDQGVTIEAEELHIQRFDGSHGILVGGCAPVRGTSGELVGAISTFADITRFKQLEQELRVGEEQRRFIGEASWQLASIALDYEGTLASVAATAVPRLADWCFVDLVEADGAIHRVAAAHVDPDRAHFAASLRRRRASPTGGFAAVARVVKSCESERSTESIDQMIAATNDPDFAVTLRGLGPEATMIVPLRARDRTLGALTFIAAESGRSFSESDLLLARQFGNCAALAVDNARLYREAQRVNRVKDEFLATLSHELRTPLNAILGWSRMVRMGKLDERGRERALETIERNARSQAQLIEDLLDVSRIISGKFRVEVHAVELPAVVEAAIDSVRLAAEARGIELSSILSPTPTISGDPTRLQQVVWNLLSNAIKFTSKGGHVALTLRQVESQIELEVVDDGQGIAADFLPYVFDRFRQADGTTTRAHNGLGLGLAIVRHLVELHGGSVRAESGGHGHGSSFLVRLPIAAVWSRPEAVEPPVSTENEVVFDELPPLHGVTVLVVDDESDAREILTMVLTEQGARVIAVGSVIEAIDAIERGKPDVLVSDIGMPREDGYTLIRLVKAMEKRIGKIPAAALTAYAGVQDRTRALLAGYSSHLPKPIEPAELAAVVANLAGRTTRN